MTLDALRAKPAPANEQEVRAKRTRLFSRALRLDGDAVRHPVAPLERRRARVHRHVSTNGVLVTLRVIGRKEAAHGGGVHQTRQGLLARGTAVMATGGAVASRIT